MKHIAYVLDAYIYYLRALSNKPKGEGKNDPGTSNSQGISLDIGLVHLSVDYLMSLTQRSVTRTVTMKKRRKRIR